MTVEEALAEIEGLGGGLARPPLAQQEIPCRDTQQAVRILAEAYGHLRKRDPLYADQRQRASLAPPPWFWVWPLLLSWPFLGRWQPPSSARWGAFSSALFRAWIDQLFSLTIEPPHHVRTEAD